MTTATRPDVAPDGEPITCHVFQPLVLVTPRPDGGYDVDVDWGDSYSGAHTATTEYEGESWEARHLDGAADQVCQAIDRLAATLPRTASITATGQPIETTPEVIVMQVELDDPEEPIEHSVSTPLYLGATPFVEVAIYQHGDFVVACPHPGCDGESFYEVDRAERWNPTVTVAEPDTIRHYGQPHPQPNPAAGLPMLHVSQGSDGDGFETDHHICQECGQKVALPTWLQTEWLG